MVSPNSVEAFLQGFGDFLEHDVGHFHVVDLRFLEGTALNLLDHYVAELGLPD